ncbi:CUE domain-containing protein 1-like [Oppia nitens]|uniref:CUE domain-containing protein 1-like n=1 Tax=Oppia nitens TaxID=1686743 RepID=UPI0023DA1A1A|nr:CUE domain-containing protein 1-like [Oppia nitens]
MTTLQSQRTGITQLEFHQAMNDFKTMFPNMDEDVIEAVLRSNNGAVDATIDQLLAMNMDSENERLRHELDTTDNNEVPPVYSPATPPPSYHSLQSQLIASNMSPNSLQPKDSNEKYNNNLLSQMNLLEKNVTKSSTSQVIPSKDSMRYKRQWNPPILGQLPQSFLRIEPDLNQRKLSALSRSSREVTVINSALLQQKMQENQRQRQLSVSADDPELSQFLEDERVAIFLQNEEFVRELQKNPDFMSTLDLDTRSNPDNTMGATGGTSHTDSDAVFKDRLKHMGKVSRRKFAQLARLFSRRKRRSFQQLLSESNSGLLSKEDQYIQFQNEFAETERQLVLFADESQPNSQQNTGNSNNSPINNSTFRTHHRI